MTTPFSERAARQAVDWLVTLQGGTNPARQQAWERWLAADPEHRLAWQRIEQGQQALRSLPTGALQQSLHARPAVSRRTLLKGLAALAASLPGLWLGHREAAPWLADHHTAVGERQRLTLADGSRLTLNTASAVNVRPPEIELVRGELFLDGATGAMVADPAGRVTLLSQTRLNLRRFADRSCLSVLDGRVALECHERTGFVLSLQAGQQVDFTSLGSTAPKAFDQDLAAWRDGMLIARQLRLDTFLAELGRYRHGWLGCDPAVSGLLLSGSYPLDDSDRVLALLEQVLPIHQRRHTALWVRLEPKPV